MDSKKVCDTDGVYSFKNLLNHKDIQETMLGRVFSILGVKNEELGEAMKIWKARCVFQGSNVRTKTGTSAADLFEESSNAPASFAAARSALGVAALKGFNASLRDADLLASVYRYAHENFDVCGAAKGMVARFVFHSRTGAKREFPNYDRFHCSLIKAL